MKNILIIALLVAIAFASLRGSDRKGQNHHDLKKERKGERDTDRSDSLSGSNENEYSLYDSEDRSTFYSSEDVSSLDSSEEDSTLYNSEEKYTLYDSDDDNTYESTLNDSESSESSSESESQSSKFNHKRNDQNKKQNRDGKRGHRGGRFNNKDNQTRDRKHPHPPRPQDEFSKKVFQNLKKTGKVILEEWNITQDPSLKNEIRAILITNLENLLPVAEVLNTQESGSIQQIDTVQPDNHPHPHPHPPPPPQPEDEFAKKVFDTLHQIGFEILESWNLEQNVEVKNQIRANLIQQLSDLIPIQQVEAQTTIIDVPIIIDTVQERTAPRLAEESGN
ncbi:unnamed protein product [Paramecium sonneborni]|uniref:Uncharacterized protein n=1 Tax=Paramecium sonneborni TaxID=65129 RepID=A0A8S1KH59_9CILI|nr:unnamed protein product [Paramecium sonneborni]